MGKDADTILLPKGKRYKAILGELSGISGEAAVSLAELDTGMQ
jgi:hypothetical protein